MSTGYIYCVSTPANTDRCKVGETLKGIEDRLKGLNTTSVSENFKLDYYIVVNPKNRFNIERSIHNDIITAGYSRFSGKEFFKCQPSEIKHIFEKYGSICTTIIPTEKKNIKLTKDKNSNIVNPTIKKLRICNNCNKTFDRKSTYDSHLSRITSCVKNFIVNNDCQYCKKHFSHKYNLTKHLKICKKVTTNNDEIEELKKIVVEQQKNIEEIIEFKKLLYDFAKNAKMNKNS